MTVVVAQATLETWEQRVRRLAVEMREAKPDPFTSTPKQRQQYARLRYELQLMIDQVPA